MSAILSISGVVIKLRKRGSLCNSVETALNFSPAQKKRLTGGQFVTPVFLGSISIIFLGLAKGWPNGLINGTYLGISCFFLNIFLQRTTAAKNGRKQANSKLTRLRSRYPLLEHFFNGLIIAPICGVSNILTNLIRQGLAHSPSFYLSLGIRETLHNLLLGMLVSILLLNTNDGSIHRSEIIVWSWKRFWRRLLIPKYAIQGLLIGLTVGITYGIKETLEGSLNNGLSDGLSDTLFLTLGYCFVAALLQGISSHHLANHHRYHPNEGIRRSLYHGLAGAIIGTFAAAAGYIVSNALASTINSTLASVETGKGSINLMARIISGLQQGAQVDFHNVLFLGLAGGLLAFLLLGGLAVLQHSILRLMLWKIKVLPLNIAHFLDYATSSVLLHKVGGGYMFIHRFLLEYFASLEHKQAQAEELEFSKPEPLVRLL